MSQSHLVDIMLLLFISIALVGLVSPIVSRYVFRVYFQEKHRYLLGMLNTAPNVHEEELKGE